jgi:hypothetical protein
VVSGRVPTGRAPSLGRPVRAVAVALVACVVAAGLLAGCSAVRSNLGTSESACYLALPTASQALRGHGRLAGVHLFAAGTLRRQIPHLYARLTLPHPAPQRLCAFEFTGHFTTASVAGPLGTDAGRYAVVVVTTPAERLLGTVILDGPPYRFEHTHVG